jgi:hypothetical protein
MKSPILATLMIGIAGLAAGTGAASQTSQDSSQEQRILKEVRQILTSEHAFDGMSISPSVRKGVVTLNGTVGSQAAKVLATTEIQDVEGIKSVMNNLNVAGGAPKPALPVSSPDVQNRNVILPFGSILPIHVSEEISSKTAHTNDTFHGTVANNVIANGYILVPAGSPVEGTIMEAKPATHLGGPGVLTLALRRMTLNAPEGPARRRLHSSTAFEPRAKSHQSRIHHHKTRRIDARQRDNGGASATVAVPHGSASLRPDQTQRRTSSRSDSG